MVTLVVVVDPVVPPEVVIGAAINIIAGAAPDGAATALVMSACSSACVSARL